MSTAGPTCPTCTTGGRKRLGPNTVARFMGDILLTSSFSETLKGKKNKDTTVKVPGQQSIQVLLKVSGQPLQVLQQVEESVAVGVWTRVERREQRGHPGVCILHVYQTRDSGNQWDFPHFSEGVKKKHTQHPGKVLKHLGRYKRFGEFSEVEFKDSSDCVDFSCPQPGHSFTQVWRTKTQFDLWPLFWECLGWL